MKKSFVLNIVLTVALIAVLGREFVLPSIAELAWKGNYKQQMYNCDHAMREHYIAKKAVEVNPSELAVDNLKASEVGLLTCHDYDKLRKRLLAWGLSENDLARIGLEALEEKSYELQRFVEIHEFRY